MGRQTDETLSWSARHDDRGELGDRIYEETVSLCRDLCARHLPAHAGYEIGTSRLSGPVNGISLHVVRGHFRALVSVQRFARPELGMGALRRNPRATELRVVATARHTEPLDTDARERSIAQWGIAGGAMGSLGAGVVGLEYAGVLSSWGPVLFLLPLFMAWRIAMAMRFHQTLCCEALPESPLEEARRTAVQTAESRDFERWRRLLDELAQQREAITQRFAMRPFRSLGALPSSMSEPVPRSPGLRSAS